MFSLGDTLILLVLCTFSNIRSILSPFLFNAFRRLRQEICHGSMVSAKITLAYMLRKFKFSTDLKFNEIQLNFHVTTSIRNENPLRIENF